MQIIVHKAYWLYFVFCVLSLAFGILLFFLPWLVNVTNIVVARLVAGWIIIQGLVTIITAIQGRKGSKVWILALIFGIIGVLLGIYALLHPYIFGVFFAYILGMLIGLLFIQSGISMAFLSSKKE